VADAAEMTTDTTTSTETTTPTEGVTVDTGTTDTTTQETASDETSLLGGAGEEAREVGDAGEGEGGEAADAPDAYEIALKDAEGNDITLDADLLAEATPILKEVGLSNEQANKIAPLALRMMQHGAAQAEAQGEQMLAAAKKDWLDQFKASELGGAKADETLHTAAKALDALGFTKGHAFRDLLDTSGLGNHPDMITTFYRLGSLLSEETTFADPGGASETKTVGHIDLYKDQKGN
jgi:hypothetical protein